MFGSGWNVVGSGLFPAFRVVETLHAAENENSCIGPKYTNFVTDMPMPMLHHHLTYNA